MWSVEWGCVREYERVTVSVSVAFQAKTDHVQAWYVATSPKLERALVESLNSKINGQSS